MRTLIDVHCAPKGGNSAEEYQDAHWPWRSTKILQSSRVRIAVADGASDSARSRVWSRLLVKDFGRGRINQLSLEERLAALAKVWKRAVYRADLPWYAEAKLRLGSYAAFVGLELSESDSVGHWSCIVCGDSVLFHVRSDQILQSLPPLRSSDFSNSPLLLGTTGYRRGAEAVETDQGKWMDGDCFYLMTDALACWYLSCHENHRDPWRDLPHDRTFMQDPTFEEWITGLRKSGEIKNDDCTLVIAQPELS